MVWNHETVPEASEDPYIKGMEEWMGMAEAVSSPEHPLLLPCILII